MTPVVPPDKCCEFDPRYATNEEGDFQTGGAYNSAHYHRRCLECFHEWAGLHCMHDGYQNPCPNCGARPVPIEDPWPGN